MEGSLRVPFIIRWPGHVPAGRVSNEIVHEVDTFTTLAKIAGAEIPTDRPIDGVDQADFFLGKSEKSHRDGFPVFVADRLEAVKWRNWKLAFYDEERDWWTPPAKLGEPKAFDLITDPKEEYPATGIRNTWAAGLAMKIVAKFQQSLEKYVEVENCGICHSDLSIINNDWGISSYPVVLGHEVIGCVVAMGPQAKGVEIGQPVGVGWGAASCMHCHQCLSGDQNMRTKCAWRLCWSFAVQWPWAIPLP
jgi:Alcohol dehydrogenase GroES-like domain/Sulfatase